MSGPTIEEYRARLRDAIVAIRDLRSQVERAERATTEPIAITGMACRFPGGICNTNDFWDRLCEGIDAIREIERWSPHEIPSDKAGTRWAGLLERIDAFDAVFFGISPREANKLDPQQRLLLEVTWEALEDAGCSVDLLMGSHTGVFIGETTLDYQQRVVAEGRSSLDAYGLTGNLLCTAAGRLSFVFGLQGPAVTVDTACSSSLVSVHLACQSLRSGESSLAIAGGVNVILSPSLMAMVAATGALSPEGRCKTFDASANGYVRSEGCGIVVLKRLSDALRDRDRIYAVIRGSAVNQDGRSTGLTTPNVLAQQDVMTQALSNARVEAGSVGYVEAHGTGTPLGDPIEIDALKHVYGSVSSSGMPLFVGALKTNVGHLEAAAGVASLIKTGLVLRHGRIPKNNHFRMLNPRIELEGSRVRIARSEMDWLRGSKSRFAGISSFGISGTNAHVIVEEAPLDNVKPAKEAPFYLLPISAKTSEALIAQAKSYAEWLSAPNEISLPDAVYTATVRRTHHEHRLSVVGTTRDDFAKLLGAVSRDEPLEGVWRGRIAPQGRPKLVFVFPGQGSQWLGMGRDLLVSAPIFRETIEAVDAAIQSDSGFSILAELCAEETNSRISEIDIVQPVLFAMEVALAALWRSNGIEPDCVVGHSMGEVAAAHIAGILSLSDAAKVICRRSRLLRGISGKGAMALVELPMAEAERAIAEHAALLSVAVSNGPRSTVVSGDSLALEQLLSTLESQGVFCRRVKVDVASHSPQVEPLRAELLEALREIRPGSATLEMRSTVTASRLDGKDAGALYWWNNLRQPVQFSQVTQSLMVDGRVIFIEMSPHPILLPSIEENFKETNAEGAAIASMRRGTNGPRSILEALGGLYVRGYPVDWKRVYPEGGRVVSLPAYAWQRERFWIEELPPIKKSAPQRNDAGVFLGRGLSPAMQRADRYWELSIRPEEPFYLADHVVRDTVVFPGTGYVELMLEAASEAFGSHDIVIEEIELKQLLVMQESGTRDLQVWLHNEPSGRGVISISSHESGSVEWTEHCRAHVYTGSLKPSVSQRPQAVIARCARTLEAGDVYQRFEAMGLQYGPCFRGLVRLWVGDGEAVGSLQSPQELSGSRYHYRAHPALLDACLQVAGGILLDLMPTETFVPVHIERLVIFAGLSTSLWIVARLRMHSERATVNAQRVVDLHIFDENDELVAIVEGLEAAALRNVQKEKLDDCLYALRFHREALPGLIAPLQSTESGAWIVFADATGVGEMLVERLRARGEVCVEVHGADRAASGNATQWTIDPTKPEQYRQAVDSIYEQYGRCRGIVYLWALDAAPTVRTSEPTIRKDIERGTEGALWLSQAIIAREQANAKLWLVTRGAQAIDAKEGIASLAQSPLLGFGRTIAMERPEILCIRLDLSPMPLQDEADMLVAELLLANADEVVFRADGRYVGRIERTTFDSAAEREISFRKDGTYLITGGLGGLGLSLALWMAREGAGDLVLVGRSSPNEAAANAIESMRALGARVHTFHVDVSRRSDLAAVFEEVRATLSPIRGIVHAAGVLADRTLSAMSDADFWAPMRPKVFGVYHLMELSQDLLLDFFVLYSGGASLIGSPGQANYAASNAFLDAIAQNAWARGFPAMSIQWGAFSDVGLAAAQRNRGERLAERGATNISVEEGLEAFARLLRRPQPVVAFARIDWSKWRESYDHVQRMASWSVVLGERKASKTSASPDRAGKAGQNILLSLHTATGSERRRLLEAHLVEQVAHVLQLDHRKIDPSASLRNLGIDSLMAIEIRNRLEASLGRRFQTSLLLIHPDLSSLAVDLSARLGFDDKKAEAASAQNAQTPAELTSLERENVLLTGATGFLGTHLLRALLRQGSDEVHCLVRAQDDAAAVARLRASLRSDGLSEDIDWRRVIPIVGDLARPYLGLSHDRFQAVSQRTRAIYHNGALLDFVLPYEQLEPINVGGTRTLLEMAMRSVAAQFHYVSSIGALSTAHPVGPNGLLEVDVSEEGGTLFEMDYARSKRAAERLVAQARDRGLRAKIYRPGSISGHSQTGVWNYDDAVCRLTQSFVRMRLAFQTKGTVPLVPVDFVADALVCIAKKHTVLGSVFHLVSPAPLPWADYLQHLRARGHGFDIVSYEEWIAALSRDDDDKANVAKALLPWLERGVAAFRLRYDCAVANTALEGSGISCPPIDGVLLERYFSYLETAGVLPRSLEHHV